MVASSSEQFAYAFSDMYTGTDSKWSRHAVVCIAVDILTRGIVEHIKTEQKLRILNGFLVCYELQYAWSPVRIVFKVFDAKLYGCAKSERTQLHCYANAAMLEHV